MTPIVWLADGSRRRVFAHGKRWVVKVAKTPDGARANRAEALAYARSDRGLLPGGARLARCRLLADGRLVMERIEVLRTRRPRWAFPLAGGQVGVDRCKRVVAYDFGDLVEVGP